MKLVVTLDSINNVDALVNSGADILLVGVKNYSCKMQGYLTFEEIKSLKTKLDSTNTLLFFNANLVCHDLQVVEYELLFQFLKQINIDGIYVTDVALIKLANEFGLKDRIIYNPETLITNSYDANYYIRQGIDAISLSKEITLDDYKALAVKVNGGIDLIGFGHYSMFHTKRHIIKNYFDFREYDKDFTNDKDVRLVEELRQESYPILEEEKVSTIFREKALCMIEHLNELTNVKYLRIDGVFKSIELLSYVVKNYKDVINGQVVNTKEFYSTLHNKFNEETDYGFLFKKTVYGK